MGEKLKGAGRDNIHDALSAWQVFVMYWRAHLAVWRLCVYTWCSISLSSDRGAPGGPADGGRM